MFSYTVLHLFSLLWPISGMEDEPAEQEALDFYPGPLHGFRIIDISNKLDQDLVLVINILETRKHSGRRLKRYFAFPRPFVVVT